MKKNFKLVLALILAAMMIVSMIPAMADVAVGTYTIEVTNGNPNVSINGKTYKAYKLFDVTYVASVTAGSTTTTTTPYGNDQTPHSYTLSTSSTFYTTAAAKAVIEKFFTLTVIEGDTTEVVVTPKMKDSTGKNPWDTGYDAANLSENSCFDAVAAYEMGQALNAYLPANANAQGTGENEKVTIDVSNNGDAGYYLVTGEGVAKNSDGTVSTDTVTAAVAVTTTDPTAKIVAKVDATNIDKKIDEQGVNGNPATYTEKANKTYDMEGTTIKDLTEDNHSIGDTVPYVVKAKMPNMTGYEKYYFIVSDTMSKGLTFKDDVAIKFVNSTGTVEKTLKKGTDFTVTSTGGNGDDTAIEIVFKNFIQYKGTEVTAENLSSLTGGTDKALIGTSWGSYEDCDIIITYSATLNEYAVIGDMGNPNTLYLTYSRKPDVEDEGTPENSDKPKNPDVVGKTPESTTKTYTTGLKVLKYTGTGADKKPLADAKFELTGTNLNVLKETNTTYFRAIADGETGTHYLLKDGTYTETAPVTVDDPATTDINEITLGSYVKTWNDDEDPAPGYIQDTMKTWSREGSQPSVKVTATTDSEGLLTFTGLACGDYVLEETEAPAGYNKLDKKLYITVSAGTTEDGTSLTDHAFVIKYKLGQDGTEQTLTSTEAAANLFALDVENQSGVELPSTGGIGTTIFYVAGSIMVLAAAILLITKRRMGAND